jgi:FkbM family methyltransferase
MKLKRFMRTTAHLKGVFTGDYEQELQRTLENCLHAGQVFYDVGANAGYVTILGAHLVGSTGKVVAFEPSTITARQLKAQLKINFLTWVDIVVKAISNEVGEAEFADDTSADMLALVSVQATHKSKRTITVTTTTLDHAMQEYPKPDVVKIDIEGAEMLALRGATKMLGDVKPTILIELHSELLCQEFQQFIREFDYQVASLSGETILPDHYYRFMVATPSFRQTD